MSNVTPFPNRATPAASPVSSQLLQVLAPAQPLNPQTCLQVTTALHSLGQVLALELRVTATTIITAINPLGEPEPIIRALRGAAPAWDIVPLPAPAPPTGPLRYVCPLERRLVPIWAPLKGIDAFQQREPLQGPLEAIQPQEVDEEFLFRLVVRPARSRLLDAALANLTAPVPITSSGELIIRLLGAAPRAPRFPDPQQRQLEQRLTLPCFEVIGVIALAGHDRARLESRARSLRAVMASTFDAGFGGFELTSWGWRADPSTLPATWPAGQYGLLLTCSELALWHPLSAVSVPGASYLKRPPISLSPQLLNRAGILLGLHHQRGTEVEVRASLDDVRQSPLILIVGKTGMGKSELNKQIVTELYQQPGPSPSCLVLDPNYDLARDLTALTPDHLRDQTFLLDHGDIDVPIGCPLMTPPAGVAPERFIEQTYGLFRSLFAEHWSESRMADLIFSLIVTLVSTPEATLWHAPKLLTDPSYRRRAVARVNDPVAIDYWREFEQLSPGAQREVIRPVTARLRRLLRVRAVRNIVCRTDGPDLGQLLNSGARIYLSTAGPDLRSVSDLLLELYLIKAQLSLEARLSSDGPRHPTVLCVDESPRFSGPTLPILIREGRKMGLTALTISTQYLKAWGETLSDAVLGNVGSLVAFQCGADDASKLASMIKPFSADELQNLDIHEAIVRLSAGGSTHPAFDIKTLRVEQEPDWETFAYIKQNTRRLFGKPKAEIERSFEPDQDDQADQEGDWLLD